FGDPITNIYRYETNKIVDGASKVAYEAVEAYHVYDWGWEISSVVTDASGAALTTSYQYYPITQFGSPDDTKLSRIDYPDGSWEVRHYAIPVQGANFATLWTVTKPYKDT